MYIHRGNSDEIYLQKPEMINSIVEPMITHVENEQIDHIVDLYNIMQDRGLKTEELVPVKYRD